MLLTNILYMLSVSFLGNLYIHWESTFEIEDGKKKEVSVVRTEFKLTDEAIDEFKAIHNEWEFEVCEKNPHVALLRDNFRGSNVSENSLNTLFSF